MTTLPGPVMDRRTKLHPAVLVVCQFWIRAPAPGSQFTYEPVHISSAGGDSGLRTVHPPLPGDLISLWDDYAKKGGQYRVIERSWGHSSWGSTNWPILEQLPVESPRLDIIVEADEGPFRNQAPSADHDGAVTA